MTARAVACGFCGGALEVTPESLRRHILICRHCDSVQRLTEDGDLVRGAVPEPAAAPLEAKVVERGETLRVSVPGAVGQVSLTRTDLERGALYVAPLGLLAVWGLDLLPGLGAWAGLGLVAAFLHAKQRALLPPVQISNGRVRSSAGFERAFAADAVRQVYATRTALRLPNTPEIEAFHVWALLDDQRRRHVAGPVRSAETALWLEEVLENRLNLAQLPVAGEGVDAAPDPGAAETTPAAETAPAAETTLAAPLTGAAETTPALDRRCDSCGGELDVDEAAARQGWLRCAFCEGLTLLYPPDAARPVLGLGRPAAERRYEIRPRADGVVVRRAGRPVKTLARVVAGLVVVPPVLGLVGVASFLGIIGALEVDAAWLIAVVVLAALALAGAAIWVGLAAAFSNPAVALDAAGARRVLRPVPLPWWPGRERRGAERIQGVRVRAYAGASQRGLVERASAQMSRSGEISGPDFAASMLAAETTTLTAVELVSPAGPPLTVAEDIEHPTEAFEIAAEARRALGRAG